MSPPPSSSSPPEGVGPRHAPGLSNIELMGALTVRLIHDLSNQLTILAGNAQVLDLVRNNPERMGKVIERIKASTTNAGELLDRFARFRQELRFRSTPHPSRECVANMDSINPTGGRWTVTVNGELTGTVALEPRWIAFAVWQVVLQCGAPGGRITISEGHLPADGSVPAYVPSRLREKRLLRCGFAWQAPERWLDEKEAAKPMNLHLATVYEIFKIIDGWAYYQFLAGGDHRFHLLFPLSN